MVWRAGFSSCGECDMDRLGFLSFIHFFDHYCIASRLVCSICEAIPGSLSVATTAVSSLDVAAVDSVEVGRSAAYSRCNSGPKTLPWGTRAYTGES
jgi:hypothetical protein